MLLTWWRNRRRRQLLSTPFPEHWEPILSANCRHFALLSSGEQQRLRNDLRILISEKNWEGCNGLVITDEIRVTIAAHAALMGIGFPANPFDRLASILVYPDTFVAKRMTRMTGGAQLESDEPRLGEAWYQGPVILVWREIREQCLEAPDGRNVIIHEFAHLLDMGDHDVDGIPELDSPEQYRQIRLGRRTVIDSYGATSRAEFFAVASETFFEQPARLRSELPQLYSILQAYYRQDPAARDA
jgi:Mlc titration factor MtfA (ptsG expression regulator)